jgi:hypothetical protein
VGEQRFTPFADLLRGGAHEAAAAAAPARAAAPGGDAPAADLPVAATLRQELARIRFAALDGFERAARRLLAELASEVLARELLLAPADTAALVRRLCAQFAAFEPLGLVLSPPDAERVRLGLPVRVDAALRPGDVILEVREGAFESHAAFRTEGAVARARSEAA